MALAQQLLQHPRAHAPGVAEVGGVGAVAADSVACTEQPVCQLGHLHEHVVGRLAPRRSEEARRALTQLRKLGESEEDLHDGVHVARVSQVAHADEARAGDGLQIASRLGDGVELQLLVGLDVHLVHRLLRLLHLHHVDAPVRQVLRQLGINHLGVLVLGVRVHVGPVRCDGAQLDHQREAVWREVLLGLLVVVERAVGTT
mmetsp:Transcript_31999/g.67330  ORF Transcript_31999/g.67330 Transcript_31999/m.67330 type:complete len:201 (-) Transcript_31999:721-1323(-)